MDQYKSIHLELPHAQMSSLQVISGMEVIVTHLVILHNWWID